MPAHRVAVLVGSLRRESLNRAFAAALVELAPETLELRDVPTGDLPLYNQDLEADVPAAWAAFREAIRSFDAVLFVTPEYNRSMPAVLKNALDVGSRPSGKNVWAGKPCAIVSVSPGAIGGFGANNHLRQSLVALDMPTLQQPTAYIGGADKLLGADRRVANPQTREFLGKFMAAFAEWVERLAPR
jgi:chromate reductase